MPRPDVHHTSFGPLLIAYATAAKVGSTVTASVNGEVVTVEVARDLTVADGDPLIVAKIGSKWFALVRTFPSTPAAGDPQPAPPAPNPVTRKGTLVVTPVETRSYRNGAWRSDNRDVRQGEYIHGGFGNHTGCVFYGSKPRSLAGATVTSARIRVRRPNAGGAAQTLTATMRLVTQATKPAGAATLGASTTGPSLRWGQTNNAFAIPTAWAQSMVDGTAGGLAFFVAGGSPYIVMDGQDSWSAAFALSINWTR